MEFQLHDNRYVIQFNYDPEIVLFLKTFKDRKWDPVTKTWSVPVSHVNEARLKSRGFRDMRGAMEVKNRATTPLKLKTIRLPKLKKQLYPFQKIGVQFLEATNGWSLLADEMGLGKTIQALTWMYMHINEGAFLVICPASLKWNWAKEIEETLYNVKYAVLSGMKPTVLPKANVYIINYDILSAWTEVLSQLISQHKLIGIITDESHYYKNWKAKRTKAVVKLVKKINYFIPISGTPIVNRPMEFYQLLRILDKKRRWIPNRMEYGIKYCDGKHDGFGWNFNGASNVQELYSIVNNRFMIRRLKKDVLTQLPKKVQSTQILPIDNRKEYRKAEDSFVTWLVENIKSTSKINSILRAEVLVKISYLRRLVIEGKMKFVFDWVDNFLAQKNKLIIFAVHRRTIEALMERYGNIAVKIDGSVKVRDRQTVVKQFQEDPNVHIFIGNIKAAGVGLTLTASSDVAFIELPWAPGDLTQAEDRAHRIGQEQTVNIYYLLTKRTIEERLFKLLAEKDKVVKGVLDGKEAASGSVLNALLDSYI